MPPTKTAIFGLNKPQVGGDNNAWGDTLNSTLDQVDTALSIAGIPVVADVTARDLRFPAPNINDRAQVASLGYQMRFGTPTTGPNKWLPEGVTRTAGPVVSAGSKGAVADGGNDDRSFLAAMDLAVATTGHAELDPGTYLVNANLTLVSHLKFSRGAKLKPANGVTITITGPIEAGGWQIFDFSAGGKFSFIGNVGTHYFDAQWFGVVGDGVTDDSAAMNNLARFGPEYTTTLFRSGLVIGLSHQAMLYNRAGVSWLSERNPMPNGVAPAPVFKWIGAAGGPSGYNGYGVGAMIFINQCPNFSFRGFGLLPNGANVSLDLDGQAPDAYAGCVSIVAGTNLLNITLGTNTFIPQMEGSNIGVAGAGPAGGDLNTTVLKYISPTQIQLGINAVTTIVNNTANVFGAYGFGSENDIEFNEFLQIGGTGNGGLGGNPNLRHIRIANVAANNQEYHRIRHNHFQGQAAAFQTTATMVNGTNAVHTDNNVNVAIGSRVRIVGAGPAGAVLDTTVQTVTDSTHFTTVANAGTGVAGARTIVNEGVGIGVLIGGSYNAKKITFEQNQMFNLFAGVQQNNGSSQFFSNSYTNNEINHNILAATEATFMIGENTEASRQDLVMTATEPITIIAGRYHTGWAKPGGAYFDASPLSPRPIHFIGNNLDNTIPTGSTLWKLASAQLIASGTGIDQPMTMSQMGYTTASMSGFASVRSVGESWITDAPALDFSIYVSTLVATEVDGGRSSLLGPGGTDSSGFRGLVLSGFFGGLAAGITGQAEAVGLGDIIGVRGQVGKASTFPGGIRADCFRAEFPVYVAPNPGGQFGSLHGFTYTPPTISGPGQVPVAYGYRAPSLAQASIALTYGFYQEGVNDANLFTGVTSFGSSRVVKATLYIDIGAGGNATPNPGVAGSETYRYRIAGAATINAPANPLKGMLFKLIIFNNTGGAITPTLNAAFLGAGFGAIGAGKSRSRHFIYDDVLAKWEPIGAVSEDF